MSTRNFMRVVPMLLSVVFFVFPQFVHAENIDAFNADIEVQTDSSFSVTETIQYVFTEPRHGIFRAIPLIVPDQTTKFYKDRILDVSLTSITKDGNAIPYTRDQTDTTLNLIIGDPNNTEIGKHTYVISYIVRGGISYEQYGGAELYWNVTGDSWPVSMRVVTARIFSPDSIMTREHSCYRGKRDSTASCDRVVDGDNGTTFTATNLDPGAGMTIAQAVDRSKVAFVEIERWKPILVWCGLLALWFIAFGTFVYRYRTRFDKNPTIIPQYEPYPGTRPMYAGLLIDGQLDPRDITACIVSLAQDGYLKIRRIESKVFFFFEVDDHEITLMRQLDSTTVSSFERSVLRLIFGHGEVVGAKVRLGSLKHDLKQQRKNKQTLDTLRSSLEHDLEENGFYQTTLPGPQKFILVGLAILVIFFSVTKFIPGFFGLPLLLFAISIIVAIPFLRRRRTEKGYEAANHLKGFKEFLSVTDKDRYAFHDTPEKNPEQFMKYLPYAIAFGVEERWAALFEGITIEYPDWYEGNTGQHFSAVNLTTSLGAFSSAFVASSSSSGVSASSGGGSVGGGVGGGGGGSW